MLIEEDNEGDGNEEWYAHVLFHHLHTEISFFNCYLWLSNYIFYFSCYDDGNGKLITGCSV